MAEHGDRSNNGHAPFRRYSPPAQNGGAGTGSGADRPMPYQRPPGNPTPAELRGQSLTHRSARRRWRQWIQPQAPQGNTAPPPQPAPRTQGRRPAGDTRPSPLPASPPPASSGPVYRTPSSGAAPPRPTPIPQPSPWVTGQPLPQIPRSDDTPRRDAATPLNPSPGGQTVPFGPPRSRSGAAPSKVTPLRQRSAWSTPTQVDTGGPPRREGSRSAPRGRAPRRRPQRAPRPVLYGIRLLILGVGMAAIAGTLLSTLNPENRAASSNSADPTAAPAVAQQRDNAPRAALSPDLPLEEKITHLENALLELEGLAPGLTQSTFLLDLDSGRYADINGGTAIAAASTIKVPILVAFLAAVDSGRLTLDQAVTLQESSVVGGSGEMQTDALGTRYTAYTVATEMMIASDNTATQLMIELLGGASALNQQFQSWGLRSTVLRNPLPDLEGTNTTSPRDLVRILTLVEQGDLLQPRSRDRLLSIMQRTYSRDLIPAGIAEGALVFNKTGDIGTLLGDVALVEAPNGKRYILSTLIQRPHNDGRAAELIRRIAETVHREMNQPLAPVGGEVSPTPEAEPTADPGAENLGDPDTVPDVPQG
ncbi:hydrolase [Leptolyngbya sp. PCC 6406]|uniref:hydrolase n=1 Tax=Leptolyngbya sp. PCC 6406 TaxID=1173264 RepID=UPI0002AC8BDE|nr:hydrolase [Leptolyngbya sp. PCC 6406]